MLCMEAPQTSMVLTGGAFNPTQSFIFFWIASCPSPSFFTRNNPAFPACNSEQLHCLDLRVGLLLTPAILCPRLFWTAWLHWAGISSGEGCRSLGSGPLTLSNGVKTVVSQYDPNYVKTRIYYVSCYVLLRTFTCKLRTFYVLHLEYVSVRAKYVFYTYFVRIWYVFDDSGKFYLKSLKTLCIFICCGPTLLIVAFFFNGRLFVFLLNPRSASPMFRTPTPGTSRWRGFQKAPNL